MGIKIAANLSSLLFKLMFMFCLDVCMGVFVVPARCICLFQITLSL